MKKLVLVCLFVTSSLAFGQGVPGLSKGQTLYLPVYSHIWFGDLDSRGKPSMLLVSVLVSIRNTDPVRPIRVMSAQYYDTLGKRLTEYVTTPATVNPLGTHELYIPKSDSAGGSGANFLISWQSDMPASPPMVEAIHAEVLGTRALAFTTSARPIDDQKGKR